MDSILNNTSCSCDNLNRQKKLSVSVTFTDENTYINMYVLEIFLLLKYDLLHLRHFIKFCAISMFH